MTAEPMTPAERSDRARLAAHTRWAKTADRAAATRPATEARRREFERQVDPDGSLDPATRARLADNAELAYMAGLRLKRSQARRARAARQATEDGSR